MKRTLKKRLLQVGLTCLTLAASTGVTYGQIVYWVSQFNSSNDIAGWGYAGYGNPFTAGVTITYNGNDAPPGGPSKGCMVLTSAYGPGSTNANLAVQTGLNGFNASTYTAIEMDVKVATNSALDQYGTAAYFQGAVETGPSYSFQGSPGFNLNPIPTNNGWTHVVWPASATGGPPTTTNWNLIQNLLIDPYDGNYTNVGTVIIEVSNVKFTAPLPTYSNFVSPTLQFDSSNDVASIYGASNEVTGLTTSWYGTNNYVAWSTNDSHDNTNSGSLYIMADFAGGNNCDVLAIPFDTNYTWYADDTNVIINLNHYNAIELDVMWDTNHSTISIDEFNSQGDINGFPIGTVAVPNGVSGDETCGSTTTDIPDAASNGWVHIVCPIDNIVVADAQTFGLFFKKYVSETTNSGVAAYWVDNITFDGAPLPTHPNLPVLSMAKPVPGLQCNFTGTAGNPDYDREMICTYSNDYSFVDAGSVTYSMTIASAPTSSSSALILFDQNNAETEPDWVDPSVLVLAIQAQTGGSQVIARCKTNSANANGDLYDASDPVFTTTSGIVGTWSFTFSGNTNILCVAPNGSTTNLPFPLGFQSADVEANFPTSGGMYVYFGAECGGATGIGGRWVLSNVSISGGTATALSENWVAEANTGSYVNGGQAGPAGSGGNALPGQHMPWTGSISGVQWEDTSDSSTSRGIYLIGTNTSYVLDWTSVAGPGLNVLTNSTLAPTGWGTNTVLTGNAFLEGNYFSTEVDETNLSGASDLFFSLEN